MAFDPAPGGLYSAALGSGQLESLHQVMNDAAQPSSSAPVPASSASANLAPPLPPPPSPEDCPSVRDDLASSPRPSIVITGAALGLPGTARVFDDANLARILRGEQFVDVIPMRIRRAMLDKHITRLVKDENGGALVAITSLDGVIKIAGRAGAFDIAAEFGLSAGRSAALDRASALAIAAGIDALRDAGIPLVMHSDGWRLPEALCEGTGVIFASAFPGYDFFARELARYHAARSRREQLTMLESLQARAAGIEADSILAQEIARRIDELRDTVEKDPYLFDPRFLAKALSMGHSQLAEFIGARGPNTQINAGGASAAQAVSLAADWIAAGRCRRVIVASADDVTTGNLLEWMGAGFLATGAAATGDVLEDAAAPCGHGILVGMGAAALVVERADELRQRGIQPICEVLSTVTANSGHGTRRDPQHLGRMMEKLVSQAESRHGISRREIAPQLVFVSHEACAPARGGSTSAELAALRHVFGDTVDRIVIASTNGSTGHPMGAGIEDVVAVKALETGCLPPVANFKEADSGLGPLNLSRGGIYPVQYALRLAAGFGAQISLLLLRWVPTKDRIHPKLNALGYAYRIADAEAWKAWLNWIAGTSAAELEVVQRTLRVRDRQAPATVPEVVQDSQPAPVPTSTVQFPPAPSEEAPQPAIAAQPSHAVCSAEVQPSADSAPGSSGDLVKERVLALAAKITGYHADLLGLGLDLEADLGVDSIKQAEIFAAVRAAYNIPRDDDLKLRDFPTLAHVIQFARDSQSLLADIMAELPPCAMYEKPQPAPAATAPPPAPEAQPAPLPPPCARPEPASFEAANRIPRRVPIPVLRPALSLCKPTGIILGPGSRVVLMPDKGKVADALTQRLQNLGVEVLRIEGSPDAGALAHRLCDWLVAGPVQGVYWLPALDHEGSLLKMDLPAWREALRLRAKLLFTTMRTLYEQIAEPGTFLISATRLGGQHGYDQAGAVAPLGGAVVGMTKTYKRERSEVLVKAVDFEPGRDADALADILIEETLSDSGAVEIGYKRATRWSVGLQEQSAIDGQPGLSLDSASVFLITGAAGSIVSPMIGDLAAASGGTFYLLDIVPEPDPANPDLLRFLGDKEGLKRDLFARIQARGGHATAALIEQEMAVLERAHAALSAINAVRAAGGTVHYFSVDLTNAEAVAGVIAQLRQLSGRIDVLLHAAGIECCHFLPDKASREFDLVFDVASDGWFNLLRAIGDMPLGATVAFGSIAGRFGNAGQADYSSAGDLLCKLASNFRTTRPATRGIAIDWTAWAGIGMAARGSIPEMMELAGIDLLPPDAGIPLIRRELTSGAARGEILIAQDLGILLHEFDPTGGLDSAAAKILSPAHGPMIGKFAGMTVHGGLTIETTLDPAQQPFLHDHQIGGTPELPGVMGIEAFAEAALALLPGYQVEAVEDVNFLAPFKFYRHQPRTVTIQALISQQGSAVLADCRLTGSRTLPTQPTPGITNHVTARVRLTKNACIGAPAREFSLPETPVIEAADIYRIYFHGPACQVLGRAWRDDRRVVGQLAGNLPIYSHPPNRPTLLAPRLIELCFQTAGLWPVTSEGRMALPRHLQRLCLWRMPEPPSGPLYAVVTRDPEQGSFDAEVLDRTGNCYLQLSGYTTISLPDRIDGELLKALNATA